MYVYHVSFLRYSMSTKRHSPSEFMHGGRICKIPLNNGLVSSVFISVKAQDRPIVTIEHRNEKKNHFILFIPSGNVSQLK